MDLQQLKAFAAAARHKNITKAASELHITQPALSKQMKKLEETYDVKLLRRSGMGVDLTGDGHEFLNYVEPILENVRTLENRFSNRSTARSKNPLTVGGSHAVASTLLPALLGTFKNKYPDVEIILKSNTPKGLEQLLLKGLLDLAVTPLLPSTSELKSEHCMRMKIVAVAAKGYRLPPVRTIQDLEKLSLIIHSGPDRTGITENFLRTLRDRGVRPNIFMRCDSPEAIKTAVLNKLGVGIIYEYVVKDGLARGIFKRVRVTDFSCEAQLHIVYRRNCPLSKMADVFRTMLLEECHLYSGQEKFEGQQSFHG
jgi:DNA-binding transcriptional LysR family regulator